MGIERLASRQRLQEGYHHVGTLTPVSNMTATTHFGWPKRLTPRSLGNNRRMFTGIKFFEGELRLIADCLRCAGPQQVVKQ
jgi:hypothetical protein